MVGHRMGLAFLGAERVQGGEDHSPLAGGADFGIRLQSPSRVAPFVGVGAFAGYFEDSDADSDGRDNDQDSFIDEFNEEDESILAAIYPEAGVHLWATPRVRLTAFARHYFATTFSDGRDYQTVGLSLSWLNRASERAVLPTTPPSRCSDTAGCVDSTPWPSDPWVPSAATSETAAENPYAAFAPADGGLQR